MNKKLSSFELDKLALGETELPNDPEVIAQVQKLQSTYNKMWDSGELPHTYSRFPSLHLGTKTLTQALSAKSIIATTVLITGLAGVTLIQDSKTKSKNPHLASASNSLEKNISDFDLAVDTEKPETKFKIDIFRNGNLESSGNQIKIGDQLSLKIEVAKKTHASQSLYVALFATKTSDDSLNAKLVYPNSLAEPKKAMIVGSWTMPYRYFVSSKEPMRITAVVSTHPFAPDRPAQTLKNWFKDIESQSPLGAAETESARFIPPPGSSPNHGGKVFAEVHSVKLNQ